MNDNDQIAQLATMMLGWLCTKQRDDGERYVSTKDGAPSWVIEVAMAAHEGGERLPNDHTWILIRGALERLTYAESPTWEDISDVGHEWADSVVDVYYADLYAWLTPVTSHYVEDARSEGFISGDETLDHQIQVGQYREALEVWEALVDALSRPEDLSCPVCDGKGDVAEEVAPGAYEHEECCHCYGMGDLDSYLESMRFAWHG